MLFTELSTDLMISLVGIAALLAIFLSALTLRQAIIARDEAAACAQFVAHQNKRSISLKRMAEVEATLTDLTDSYDSLLKQHKKLRSRIGMRENRQRSVAELASETVDELRTVRDKRELRLRCKERGLLK